MRTAGRAVLSYACAQRPVAKSFRVISDDQLPPSDLLMARTIL